MFKKTPIIIFLFVIRQSFAGLLDSVIGLQTVISLEESKKIELQFERHIDDFCFLPGSILHFSSDSTCYNPVQEYIDKYASRPGDAGDSVHESDSTIVFQYRVAMQTYRKFRRVRQNGDRSYSFSHAAFFGFLEEEKTIREKPWSVKLLEKVSGWIENYVLLPLAGIIADSIGKMPLLLKTVVIGAATIVFIFLVIIIAGFTRRIYPDIEVRKNGLSAPGRTISPSETDWLAKARECAGNALPADASECIYRHLVGWFQLHNKIRRYEWWTNRQFLHIIKDRFNDDYATAEAVVTTYERCIFGHLPADGVQIGQLIEKAGTLRGKRSS